MDMLVNELWVIRVCMEEMELGREMWRERCVANTWFRKGEKRKMMYSAGGSGTEIDFVLVGKENRKYLRDMKIIPGELQYRLVVTYLVKKKAKKVVRKEAIKRRRIWKLKEEDTRARFEGRVGELEITDALDLWKCFKEGVLKACDEVCGKKNGRRDQGDTWWWNEDVKEVMQKISTCSSKLILLNIEGKVMFGVIDRIMSRVCANKKRS